MRRFLVVFITLLPFLNADLLDSSSPEHKPSRSKLKLSREDDVAALKNIKPANLQIDSSGSSYSEPSTTDLGITLPEEYANDTITFDHHTYYNSTFYADPQQARRLWVDLDKLPQEHVITHATLSDSHRQASTIDLSFDFPFYGSPLRNLTIATGGFLYMGDYLHNWIAATQYVAPLMANFDTTLSANSTIKYADNGTAFTVQWDHVHIQDRMSDGAFTFQTTLYKNGDICFAYKEVPFPISEISDAKHPVKVGISDAYILERAVFFVRRKTIYEYHRIDMMKKQIGNDTAIYFTALPTCLSFKTCDACAAAPKELECAWCEAVQRCSDGVDRQRQSWVVNGCTIQHQKVCSLAPAEHSEGVSVSTSSSEAAATSTTLKTSSSVTSVSSSTVWASAGPKNPSEVHPEYGPPSEKQDLEIADRYMQGEVATHHENTITTGAIVAIVIFIALLLGIGTWIFYAYRFPQSASGQFLIKYRPSQWNLKPEGRSSNADAFHM